MNRLYMTDEETAPQVLTYEMSTGAAQRRGKTKRKIAQVCTCEFFKII